MGGRPKKRPKLPKSREELLRLETTEIRRLAEEHPHIDEMLTVSDMEELYRRGKTNKPGRHQYINLTRRAPEGPSGYEPSKRAAQERYKKRYSSSSRYPER